MSATFVWPPTLTMSSLGTGGSLTISARSGVLASVLPSRKNAAFMSVFFTSRPAQYAPSMIACLIPVTGNPNLAPLARAASQLASASSSVSPCSGLSVSQ